MTSMSAIPDRSRAICRGRACFALGLMAKPMLVTLPPLLAAARLLALGTIRLDAAGRRRRPRGRRRFLGASSLDKLPLLALALAAAGVTDAHPRPDADPLTLPERLANAAVSCVAYLGQFFVPVGLSIFYSHPEAGWPAWQVAAAAALLVGDHRGRGDRPPSVSLFVRRLVLVPRNAGSRARADLVGVHARADRYTYLSQIGLYIALVWGAMRLRRLWPARRWVFGIGSALMLAALMACAWRQTGYWQDSITLWQHAVDCDPKSVTAHYSLGRASARRTRRAAVAQYRQALATGSKRARTSITSREQRRKTTWAIIAARKGDLADAIAHYRQAIELDPDLRDGPHEPGGPAWPEAEISTRPWSISSGAWNWRPTTRRSIRNLAVAQAEHGEVRRSDRRTAARPWRSIPNWALAHSNLAAMLAQRGDVDEAIVHFRRAIEIDPDNPFSYQQMAQLLRKQGKMSEAARYDERAKKASRRLAESHDRRGTELAHQGKIDQAIAQFQMAIAVDRR